jgi:hypothetical protein
MQGSGFVRKPERNIPLGGREAEEMKTFRIT